MREREGEREKERERESERKRATLSRLKISCGEYIYAILKKHYAYLEL